MNLLKYIGEWGNGCEEQHQHDYRWIKDKKEREAWIKKNWEVKE